MTEISNNNLEKVEPNKTKLEKAAEKVEKLDAKELNTPLENVDLNNLEMPKAASLDCRSECKYHTGSGSKYANYGFSD